MNRISTLLSALILATGLLAQQTAVEVSSFAFSDGVHPTFSFLFEGTDVKYVESFWRDELKKISTSVSSKKEVIGAGALLPQVSPDTVRILVKAEQRKNSPLITAHVAILTTAGYVGPTTNERAYEAARAFVQQHSTALRRQLAQQELTHGRERAGPAAQRTGQPAARKGTCEKQHREEPTTRRRSRYGSSRKARPPWMNWPRA